MTRINRASPSSGEAESPVILSNSNPMHSKPNASDTPVWKSRDSTAVNAESASNVTRSSSLRFGQRSRSRVSSAVRDEITDRLGIKSGRFRVCCGKKWDKHTCKNIQFTLLFVSMVLVGGAIFQAIEETNAIERNDIVNRRHAMARARVLALLGGNKTLFNQIAEAAVISDGCTTACCANLPFKLTAFAPTPKYTGSWTFLMSSLFAFELVTTIGYGTYAPKTSGGRLFLVLCSLVGIPAATMTLLHLAERALHCCSRLVQLRTDKIRKAFEAYDNDNSGQLDIDEFREAIQHLGMKLTEYQFQELVAEIDADASGEIDLHEFEVAISVLQADVTEAAGQKNRIKVVTGLFFAWMTIGVLYSCN